MSEDTVYHGGLYRCCLVSLDEHIQAGTSGERVQCRHCGEFIKRDEKGVWCWDRSTVGEGEAL
jgi:hypothetical protein